MVGTFLADLANCDGSQDPVKSNAYCTIPLTHLQSNSFTGLGQGDRVVAKVKATNSFGTGTESDVNTSGALIETVPHKPAAAPTRGTQTSPV